MQSNDQQVILNGLADNATTFQYETGRRLAELFPDKYLLATKDQFQRFDLSEFVEAGFCVAAPRKGVFQEIVQVWYEDKVWPSSRNSVEEVRWNGEEILAFHLAIKGEHCDQDYWWLLAETEEIAQAFFSAVCKWNSELHDEVLVFDNGFWQKNHDLYESIQSATFDNLVLPGELKAEIQRDFAAFFASKDEYAKYGVPWKRGVLLYGDPGNGKTHTLKALVNQLGVSALYVRSFATRGEPEQFCIARIFQRAREMTPCLLIFEDLDSLINNGNRSYFLNELDGFAANSGMFVVATTNHPERLDPAIVDRPSRFDRKYVFPLPSEELRAEYLALWHRQVQEDLKLSDEGILALAAATEGFSFAYLKELWLSAIMDWMRKGHEGGSMDTVMLEQVDILRSQMSSEVEISIPTGDFDPSGFPYGPAMHSMVISGLPKHFGPRS